MQSKKSSLSQTQLTILETIEAQVAQEKELLSQVQHQVRALTTRRQQLRDEIESETSRLLARREKELNTLLTEKQKPLQHQENLFIATEKHVGELRELELQLETRLQDLYKQVEKQTRLVQQVKSEYSECRSAIQTVNTEKNSAESVITGLQTAISSLESRVPVLQDECASLEAKKLDLEVANEQLATDFVKQKAENERKLQVLLMKQQQVYEDTVKQQHETETVRKDIAIRVQLADRREKVIRARELKVAQNEETIQHNAELLNL